MSTQEIVIAERRGRDDVCAGMDGQLGRDETDSSGSPVDEYRVTANDTGGGDRVHGGEPGQHHRARFLPAHAGGFRRERRSGHDDVVRVGACDGIHDDFVADSDSLDVRPESRDDARALDTEAWQRLEQARSILLVLVDLVERTAVELPIEWVDADRANFHDDLASAWGGGVDVGR